MKPHRMILSSALAALWLAGALAARAAPGEGTNPAAIQAIAADATAPVDNITAASATPTAPSKGLHFAAGPANGAGLVAQMAQEIMGVQPGEALATQALPMFSLSSGRLLAADGTLALRDNGRVTYYVKSAGNMLGTVVVLVDAASGLGTLGGGSRGVSPEIPTALAALAAREPVKAGSYEARQVVYDRIIAPGQSTSSPILWLKADAGGVDLIYPIRNAPPGTVAGQLYTMTEFTKALADHAAAMRSAGQPAATPATGAPAANGPAASSAPHGTTPTATTPPPTFTPTAP